MRYPAARSLSLFLMLGALACAASAQNDPAEALTVVPGIDLPRYMGTWYEVARLPNPFQKQCAGEVTATYTLRDDGEIDVVNRCRSATGEVSEAKGRARRADDEEPNSKLKVRFAPAFLSFLPFVWGDYWILELSPDYTYAVIGEPERRYLWILSRTPSMAESALEPILARITRQGYDCSGLIRTGIIAGADSNRVSLAPLRRSPIGFRD